MMATMTPAADNPHNSSLAKYYSSKIVELREVSDFCLLVPWPLIRLCYLHLTHSV